MMVVALRVLLIRRVVRVIVGAIMVRVNQWALSSLSFLAYRKLIILFLFLFFYVIKLLLRITAIALEL